MTRATPAHFRSTRYQYTHDVRTRLNRTIVEYSDNYYYCTVDEEQSYYVNLNDFESPSFTVDANSPALKHQVQETGYMWRIMEPYKYAGLFVYRSPLRRYKAGLCPEDLEVKAMVGNKTPLTLPSLTNPYKFKMYVNMIRGHFRCPSIILKELPESIAKAGGAGKLKSLVWPLSRNVGLYVPKLGAHPLIVFRNIPVGKINLTQGTYNYDASQVSPLTGQSINNLLTKGGLKYHA